MRYEAHNTLFTRKSQTFFELSQLCNAQTINTIVFFYDFLRAILIIIRVNVKILCEKILTNELFARNYIILA